MSSSSAYNIRSNASYSVANIAIRSSARIPQVRPNLLIALSFLSISAHITRPSLPRSFIAKSPFASVVCGKFYPSALIKYCMPHAVSRPPPGASGLHLVRNLDPQSPPLFRKQLARTHRRAAWRSRSLKPS